MSLFLIKLSSVLGLSLTSGINLYATVAVVGLVTKFDLVKGLPEEFQAFNNDVIIGVALVLYACEFLADKIPAFDSVWDTVHTAIRPFGAALIAMTVVGDADPVLAICAGLVGASLGLATHSAKAGTRLVANTSPEPVSNVALSLGEDAAVVGGTVLVMSHPYIALVVSIVLLALLARFGPGLWRAGLLTLKAVPAKIAVSLTGGSGGAPQCFLPDALQEVVDTQITDAETVRVMGRCHARKVKGCGWNRGGYLIVTDSRMLFAFRRFFRARTMEWSRSSLTQPAVSRRFLVDVLRVKSDGRFINFVFVKSRAAAAGRLVAALAEGSGRGEPDSETEKPRKVVSLSRSA